MFESHQQVLERRHNQLAWEENAHDLEAWLSEREAELGAIVEPRGNRQSRSQSHTEDPVLIQLQALQRQEKFQVKLQHGNCPKNYEQHFPLVKGALSHRTLKE